MCTLSQPARPSSPAQAVAMVHAGLGYLSSCDAAGLGTAAQAEALVGLEQAEARHTAARARILAAFTAQHGFQAGGHYGPGPGARDELFCMSRRRLPDAAAYRPLCCCGRLRPTRHI